MLPCRACTRSLTRHCRAGGARAALVGTSTPRTASRRPSPTAACRWSRTWRSAAPPHLTHGDSPAAVVARLACCRAPPASDAWRPPPTPPTSSQMVMAMAPRAYAPPWPAAPDQGQGQGQGHGQGQGQARVRVRARARARIESGSGPGPGVPAAPDLGNLADLGDLDLGLDLAAPRRTGATRPYASVRCPWSPAPTRRSSRALGTA
eukprot:scaffold79101_cov65-Phaeocystis_antarctica.AAC.9